MVDQERLINSFSELVRIDSPSNEEEDVSKHLEDRLSRLGFQVERDAHGNVIASEPGDEPLLLSAHMDTVEPGRGIKPQIVGDRIESDGTTILGGDCKAGVAAILEALESTAQEGRSRRPVQVVFTRGEEIGLVGATNLDYSMIRAKESVVFDGNGPVNSHHRLQSYLRGFRRDGQRGRRSRWRRAGEGIVGHPYRVGHHL